MKGEELKKQIGAAAYIECSAKTQQVIELSRMNFAVPKFVIHLVTDKLCFVALGHAGSAEHKGCV